MLEAIYIFLAFYSMLLLTYGLYFFFNRKATFSYKKNKPFYFTTVVQNLFLFSIIYLFFTTPQSAISVILGSGFAMAGLAIKFLALKEWSKPKTGILKSGIYSLIRHPMYTGNIIVYFGLSLMLSVYGFFLFLLIPPAFIIRGRTEEKEMKSSLYLSYKRKVSGFLPNI